MPIPTPNDGESEDDFIGRCMGNETMVDDYPDPDQRAAVCYSQFRERAAQMRTKLMATLSEKHRELKRRRADLVEKMGAIVKEDDGDEPLDEDKTNTFDQLSAAIAAIDERLRQVATAMQAAVTALISRGVVSWLQ